MNCVPPRNGPQDGITCIRIESAPRFKIRIHIVYHCVPHWFDRSRSMYVTKCVLAWVCVSVCSGVRAFQFSLFLLPAKRSLLQQNTLLNLNLELVFTGNRCVNKEECCTSNHLNSCPEFACHKRDHVVYENSLAWQGHFEFICGALKFNFTGRFWGFHVCSVRLFQLDSFEKQFFLSFSSVSFKYWRDGTNIHIDNFGWMFTHFFFFREAFVNAKL